MSQSLPERRPRLAPDRWEPFSEFEQMAELEANLNDGVLTVRIPKAEREQRRKIEVKA